METEVRYRFCVRAKPAPHLPDVSRRVFITPMRITEQDALDRYEVVERLDHTAVVVSDDSIFGHRLAA